MCLGRTLLNMKDIEKHGGLWVGGTPDELVFEQFEPALDLILAVWRTRTGLYLASIFEKSYDYRMTIPTWSERRPSGWFANEEEARKYLKERIEENFSGDKLV